METRPELSVKEIYQSLSDDAQKLLIAMCVPAETGVKREAIVAFSGVEETKLDSAMRDLKQRGLFESGKREGGNFVVGEGDRYRLPPKVKEQVLRDIVKLKSP